MRSCSARQVGAALALALVAACSETTAEEPRSAAASGVDTDSPPERDDDVRVEKAVVTFAERTGDARGAGLDLSDTKVGVDDDGVLVVHVAIPAADRSKPVPSDNVQVYLDVDRDHEKNGYDVRLVLFGDEAHPFAVERWENEAWRDRTPASYEASFDHGIHVRVLAADVGIGADRAFDLFVASVDEETGMVSDLAPDGALRERWTYSR